MEDENKSGLSEVAEKSASAANTIKGAIKAGKAISGAAKGAAVGGPFGAAAGLLWQNRKLVGKIAAAAAFLLLLPVLFIMMLPSLIFGDLTSSPSASPGVTAAPVMNDNAAITENINNITFAVNSILGEGIDDVKARIATDFASSGGDKYEIINPFENDPSYNINLYISQYCAAKNKDFANISQADMENVLRGAKSNLFAFTRKSEPRQVVQPAQATPAPTVSPVATSLVATTSPSPSASPSASPTPAPAYETWMVYTIVYNGEGYFADTVFALSAEQKVLAQNYAENLSLFLGDGMLQFLSGSEYSSITYEGIVFADGLTPVVYYNQGDTRYSSKPYGTDNIGGYGCGPTAMSIVVSSLTSNTVDPVQMAKWAYDNGYWCSGSGSYHSLIPGAAKHWNLPVEGCTASEPQRIVDALTSGKLVVAIMAKGSFTKGGHFIVLRGVNSSGKITVADPGSYSRSGKEWDLSLICNEASKRAGAGGPFWLIG